MVLPTQHLTRIFLFLIISLSASALHAASQTLLMSQPTVSSDHLAFVYGGDLWLTDRAGKQSRRLTTHPARESHPHFSPDGQWIAFTAYYDNNADVYVLPVKGGQPKRLTWHGSADIVNGWSADGKSILFTSDREVQNSRSRQAYHVSLKGGLPEKIMEGLVFRGSWSEDGTRLAYSPNKPAYYGASGWRQHRGGATPPIWIIDSKTQLVEKVPHVNASDINPFWLGEHVYFISDRNDGAANLFQYDTKKRVVKQLTSEKVWDIRNAAGKGKSVVYEAGGRLKELNIESGKVNEIIVAIHPDSQQLRAQWKDASKNIQSMALSPTGKRVLLTARGDIFTVPVEDGSTRNITRSSGVREKDALWSPSGDKIAYISDKNSIHKLIVTAQTGFGKPKSYALGDTAYYTLRAWTPDGKRIIYQDNHLNLYMLSLQSGKYSKIATEVRRSDLALSISPDSRWIAYALAGENYFVDIYLHNLETGKKTKVTDGMVDAHNPVFSKDGKYLYFTASNNSGPVQLGLEMSTRERPIRSSMYVVVLSKNSKSPLAAKSDEEEINKNDNKEDSKKDEVPKVNVTIDFEGIAQRIVSLPVALKFYDRLSVSNDGSLFYIEKIQAGASRERPGTDTSAIDSLFRFDFEKMEPQLVSSDVADYILSDDGKHILIQGKGGKLSYAKVEEKLSAEAVALADVKSFVDPRQEWRQILDETWRMQRDYFYAENMHGINWESIKQRYEALLPHVTTREDLNRVLVEMIAELQVGHNRTGGGDIHREKPVTVGLLGADLRVEKANYRIQKIYTGERWNPFLKAPLAEPGLGINEGDYILAVNGERVRGSDNIFSFFEGTAGKQVTLTVSKSSQLKDAKEVVVEPIAKDAELRRWHWIEKNRAYVEKKTNGRVGYIYLPDTADKGFRYFNRMFFAQINKEALIIDERRNGGGHVANYIIDILSRQQLAGWKERDGADWHTPVGAVYGPKVMLIDQDAGSGGDFLPYAFSRLKLGRLVGTRTWGGLIGISANPGLIDGATLVVPFFRIYTPEGQWAIENEGVSPDIHVELETADVNKGVDTQLDKAIAEVRGQLENYKEIKVKKAPPLPTQLGQ